MRVNILRIGLLAMLACALAGCKCSSGDGGSGSGAKLQEAAKSTKEHSLFKDVDWSKYVYEVNIGDWSYHNMVFVRIDEAASGRKFEEGLGEYDVIAVPHKGKKVLIRVSESREIYTEEGFWQIAGTRPDTREGDWDFDWEPFRKYAE